MPHARQVWLAAVVLASLGPAARSAGLPQPVCGRDEVLDLVAGDIARSGMDAVIVPGSIGETPTARADTVRCAVRLQATSYDTNRYGYVPQVRLMILEFTVHAGRNGLFVHAIGPPR